MTVIVETGAGVRGANSYVDAAFVLAYLTDRDREADWVAAGATVQDAAVVAATDYIEKRWGSRFRGSREFSFDPVDATGSVVFAGLPLDTETLTLGDQVYTFVDSLSGAADEVLIGSDADETAANLAAAIDVDAGGAGVTYGEGTTSNRHASAEATGATVDLTAAADGEGGNSTVLSGSPTNVTLNAFVGGLDGGSQPLSFPNLSLFDRSGRRVLGIPRKLREATAEYADRARAAALDPDPETDPSGASLTRVREKVGPIEEEREFVEGTHLVRVTKPYPAADRLLSEYVTTAGAVR